MLDKTRCPSCQPLSAANCDFSHRNCCNANALCARLPTRQAHQFDSGASIGMNRMKQVHDRGVWMGARHETSQYTLTNGKTRALSIDICCCSRTNLPLGLLEPVRCHFNLTGPSRSETLFGSITTLLSCAHKQHAGPTHQARLDWKGNAVCSTDCVRHSRSDAITSVADVSHTYGHSGTGGSRSNAQTRGHRSHRITRVEGDSIALRYQAGYEYDSRSHRTVAGMPPATKSAS